MEVTLGGISLSCRFRYPETGQYFPGPDPGAPRVGTGFVCITEEDWRFFKAEGVRESAHSEYSLLCFRFSDALLAYDRVLIHGVALRWRDRAYLICAGSGVGKSTQARLLQELRPGEFSVICGDRPILQFCHSERSEESVSPVQSLPPGENVSPQTTDEGTILVHPSPWNGKENWHGAEAAPLAGLILLERGEENRIVSMRERDSATLLFPHIIQSCDDPANIHRAAALETRLLRSVPVWKLTTFHAPDSARLLLETVFSNCRPMDRQ